MYAYIKDRVVVNVLPNVEEPAASCADFVLQRENLSVGDPCEEPYFIREQILALEAKQPRAMREALLGGDKSRLETLDAEIAELRARL